MFAPAGTPKDVIAKINAETTQLLATPEVRARIQKEGADPVASTPEQFDKRIRNEVAKWAKVVKAAGLATEIMLKPADTPATARRSARR